MTVHEFGSRENPVLLLLPGTSCYWKAPFEHVIEELTKHFLVAIVSYTGFEEGDTEHFGTMLEETAKIEAYVKANYSGRICGAYGSSLGGSFVGFLTARKRIHMQYGILGSSDLDQTSPIAARMAAAMIGRVIYPFIHTGHYRLSLMQKRYEKQMADPDPYNRAFVAMTGRDRFDMSYIAKESIQNQFRSDLETALPLHIRNGETEIHVFYAEQMGEKYLTRYQQHFPDAVIHRQNLRHEEFLALHGAEWCRLVEEILCRETSA